jgi:hypothetical protein
LEKPRPELCWRKEFAPVSLCTDKIGEDADFVWIEHLTIIRAEAIGLDCDIQVANWAKTPEEEQEKMRPYQAVLGRMRPQFCFKGAVEWTRENIRTPTA